MRAYEVRDRGFESLQAHQDKLSTKTLNRFKKEAVFFCSKFLNKGGNIVINEEIKIIKVYVCVNTECQAR